MAYYKEMPDYIYETVMGKLPEDLKEVIMEFENKYK